MAVLEGDSWLVVRNICSAKWYIFLVVKLTVWFISPFGSSKYLHLLCAAQSLSTEVPEEGRRFYICLASIGVNPGLRSFLAENLWKRRENMVTHQKLISKQVLDVLLLNVTSGIHLPFCKNILDGSHWKCGHCTPSLHLYSDVLKNQKIRNFRRICSSF